MHPRNSPKPAPAAAFVHPHAEPAALETPANVPHNHDSKLQPQLPNEATMLRILHIPSNPSVSCSFLALSRRTAPPASLSIVQRSKGLAQVAKDLPELLPPASNGQVGQSRQQSHGHRWCNLRKINRLPAPPRQPSVANASLLRPLGKVSRLPLIPIMESFKVIAFDKLPVNSNLFRGNR